MDIDIAVLRALEREKDIPFDLVVRTIEQALLVAYHRTEGAEPRARAELDRGNGHAVGPGDGRRWRGRANGTTRPKAGRIAATTARQTILQRLRTPRMSTCSASSSGVRAISSPNSAAEQ
jgi:N utilization substance protein A